MFRKEQKKTIKGARNSCYRMDLATNPLATVSLMLTQMSLHYLNVVGGGNFVPTLDNVMTFKELPGMEEDDDDDRDDAAIVELLGDLIDEEN